MSTSNLRISIAALSLCVSAVAAYIYFPYVIAAVSGSGAIEAVPLAIFAVSAIVALVSVICLIRLAVSRAGDKKKIDLSGEQQTGSKQSTTEEPVHEDNTNLKDELIRKKIDSKDIGLQTEVGGLEHVNINQPTPQPQDLVAVKKDIGSQTEVGGLEHVNINQPTPLQPQPILSIAIPQNNNASSPSPSGAPPPPPPLPSGGLKNWNPQKNNTTGEKSSVGTTQENTPPRKKYEPPGGGERQNGDSVAELSKRLKSRRKGISGEQEDDEQQSNKLEGVYGKISAMIPLPRNSSVSSDSGNVSDDEDWETDPEPIEQVSSGSQSLHRERSESLDSDYGSDTTSPSHSVPKVEKPLAPLKPAGLQMRSPVTKMNNVDLVDNEVPNSPPSSLKERIKFLNSQRGGPVFPH